MQKIMQKSRKKQLVAIFVSPMYLSHELSNLAILKVRKSVLHIYLTTGSQFYRPKNFTSDHGLISKTI